MAPELRIAAKTRQLSEQQNLGENIKQTLTETISSMTANGIKLSERKAAKKMGVCSNSPFFKEAWSAHLHGNQLTS
ncbi:hypothetical protein [Undibacterium sp.]|uniref:hypothetical protein n=1 Tax=Undibacterium sp. TaxID=1914977 RepID=UPI002729FC34|nr:hypothetical protein [Undibacterium sp.]